LGPQSASDYVPHGCDGDRFLDRRYANTMAGDKNILTIGLGVALVATLSGCVFVHHGNADYCWGYDGCLGHGMMRHHHAGRMHGMMRVPSAPSRNSAGLPEPDSAGAKLVAEYCTQCHSLPDPAQHTALVWPSVAQRMAARMRGLSVVEGSEISAPSAAELRTIVTYLQSHANKPGGSN
jgi:hypothetical protein